MKKFFKKIIAKSVATSSVDFLINKEIEENKKVLQSLKDHDSGKKTISTTRIRDYLSNI